MLRLYGLRISLAHCNLLSRDARNFGNLFLKTAHSRFVCVLVNYLSQGRVAYFQGLPVQAVFLQLLRYQILLGNLHFLLSKIAADIDEFHTVQKRRLDRRDAVRCCDEEHIGQIVVYIQVVVVESAVLFRVERFQQG